ncbi:MAG TPA: GntR family transcriptional regulator [Limnochordales bacterium]
MSAIEEQIQQLQRGEVRPIRDIVFHYLRQCILGGRYKYGDRLIEAALAAELNVSRTPVREALRKLELEGLVEYRSRRGAVVVVPSVEDMEEIYAVRSVLEGLAARLCAQVFGEQEKQELRRLLEEMNRAYLARDWPTASRLHTAFNDYIYRGARNRRLYEIVSRLHEYTERAQMLSMQREGRMHEIVQEHNGMVEAICAGDPDLAEQRARQHVENGRQAFIAVHRRQAQAAGIKSDGRIPVPSGGYRHAGSHGGHVHNEGDGR